MSKRRIWLLAALVVCIAATLAVALAVAGSGSSAAAATSADPNAPTTTFDANAPWPTVLPVIYVSGTPYEMGYQYGQQAKDEIAHNACVVTAFALAQYHTWAAVVASMQTATNVVAAKTPDVLQVWQGIADGSGVPYDQIRLLNVDCTPPAACSTISAWGDATKDHELIAGSSTDTLWLTFDRQFCVLVAYPDNGNSFIASSVGAGNWTGQRSMNDKGLVIMQSSGQGNQPADNMSAIQSSSASRRSSSTATMPPRPKTCSSGSGRPGHGTTTSSTPAATPTWSRRPRTRPRCASRATSARRTTCWRPTLPRTKTMRPDNDPNQLQDGDLDDWYRYGSEEQLIKQNYGQLTAGSLMAILGCHNYYGSRDPVTGAVDTTKPQTWHYDVLNTQPASDEQSIWTPGMRGISWSPGMREVWLPAQKTLYVMTGNDDPLFAWTANTTGEFCKLVLADNPGDVTAQALTAAQLQTWYGAVALHRTSNPSAARLAELNEAKAAIAKGMNLQTQAGLAADPNQTALLLGQATTCFCEAQCYAEQAQGIVSNSGQLPPSS